MVKKFLLSLILVAALLPTLAKADSLVVPDILKKLPDLKQGVAFDLTEYKFNYLSTVGIIKFNDFGLSAGYSSDDKIVATLNYDLGGLRKFGIDTPITNLIDLSVGFYAGYGRVTGSNEFSYGPTVTVINLKF